MIEMRKSANLKIGNTVIPCSVDRHSDSYDLDMNVNEAVARVVARAFHNCDILTLSDSTDESGVIRELSFTSDPESDVDSIDIHIVFDRLQFRTDDETLEQFGI